MVKRVREHEQRPDKKRWSVMMARTDRMVVCASHSPLMASSDGGSSGVQVINGIERASEAVSQFAPDLVVFFGPDHVRAFRDVVPAFAVIRSADGYGDWGTPETSYDVDGPTATGLAEGLLGAGYDVTVADDVRLDHGFGQTFSQLFGELDAVPCIPIMVNCARPPLAPVRRAVGLGQEVGRLLSDDGRRVLYVGSGGLSHSPPALESDTSHLSEEERRDYNLDRLTEAAERIDPDWDRRFLRAIEHGDLDWLKSLTPADLAPAGVGANEIRTWAAACAAGGVPVTTMVYEPVPQWITGMGVAVGKA